MKTGKICALATAATLMVAAAATTASAADTWRHGVVKAKGDAGISFMPTKFAGDFDLDIDMVEFASSTVPVKALLSGELDSYATTPLVGIAAMAQGAPLKFIGCDWPGMTYDLYGSAEMKSMQDLKGKKVGISGPGGAPDLFTREALRSADMDPSEVIFTNAGGGGDRFRALVAGIVDATATSSEFEPEAERRGLTVLARAPEATPNLLRICLVTSDKVIEEKPDELARFLAAQMVGYKYAMEHPEETYTLAREVAGLAPDDTGPQFIFEEATKYNAVTPDLPLLQEKLQWNADMLQRNGRIDKTVDISQFVAPEPREQAKKLVDQAPAATNN